MEASVKKYEINSNEQREINKYEIKAYPQRWIVLGIYMFYNALNGLQWIEYCSIESLVVKYYGVSSLAVDWTAIIFMALYPPLVIPASIILDKRGLRVAGLLGCIGTLIGTSIKVVSIRKDLFPVVLLGQAILSASQLVIASLPPKIASVWFKPNEVSTACSLGVLGCQLGTALGYILPPMLVHNSDSLDDIGHGLTVLCWVLTAAMFPVTIAIIFYFPKEPPLPPSLAQARQRETREEFDIKFFFSSVKQLLSNRPFVIHMFAYGISVAAFSAISTLLTQFILDYFDNAEEDAGRIGFVMVVGGMVGCIVFGILLDKTHKYKEISLFIYIASGVTVIGMMFALKLTSMVWTYITCALFGTFTIAYMPVGFEIAMELTFPMEESTTTGILFSMTQLLGVIFTVGVGYLNKWMGSFSALISQTALLFVGALITVFVPNLLLRQNAFKETRDERISGRGSFRDSKLLFIH